MTNLKKYFTAAATGLITAGIAVPVLAALDFSTPIIIGGAATAFITAARRTARNWHEYEGERGDDRTPPPSP